MYYSQRNLQVAVESRKRQKSIRFMEKYFAKKLNKINENCAKMENFLILSGKLRKTFICQLNFFSHFRFDSFHEKKNRRSFKYKNKTHLQVLKKRPYQYK